MLARIVSILRGAAWLVRSGGLRGAVERLEARLEALAQAQARSEERDAARAAALSEERGLARAEIARQLEQLRAELARFQPLPRVPGDLRNFESKLYSQNGEDGILEEILRRVGEGNRSFVEFGVQSGVECNCARLAWHAGWSGLFLEADPTDFAALEQRFAERPDVRCGHERVSSSNIEALFAAYEVPPELDLLSIDIDGNDYWVWRAIEAWRPRIVVIEYNAAYPPPTRWVMEENDQHRWGGDTYYGASLMSLALLGSQKGYELVGTDSRGVNAFFVRRDLTEQHFLEPLVRAYFTPPAFGEHFGGHPPGSGPALEI